MRGPRSPMLIQYRKPVVFIYMHIVCVEHYAGLVRRRSIAGQGNELPVSTRPDEGDEETSGCAAELTGFKKHQTPLLFSGCDMPLVPSSRLRDISAMSGEVRMPKTIKMDEVPRSNPVRWWL